MTEAISLFKAVNRLAVDSDHHPIIRKRAEWEAYPGGPVMTAWSVGCICGWLDPVRNGWYIPSEDGAKRVYEGHLRHVGILADDEDNVESDEDSDRKEELEYFQEELISVVRTIKERHLHRCSSEEFFDSIRHAVDEVEDEWIREKRAEAGNSTRAVGQEDFSPTT